MKKEYHKKAFTTQEIINKLSTRGLLFSDKKKAAHILSHIRPIIIDFGIENYKSNPKRLESH